jgi:hypothetical protein
MNETPATASNSHRRGEAEARTNRTIVVGRDHTRPLVLNDVALGVMIKCLAPVHERAHGTALWNI